VIWDPTYRERVERLFQGGTNAVGKEHFTSLYSFAREKAFTKRNITSAWAAGTPIKLEKRLLNNQAKARRCIFEFSSECVKLLINTWVTRLTPCFY
jgi:hypothetical protein